MKLLYESLEHTSFIAETVLFKQRFLIRYFLHLFYTDPRLPGIQRSFKTVFVILCTIYPCTLLEQKRKWKVRNIWLNSEQPILEILLTMSLKPDLSSESFAAPLSLCITKTWLNNVDPLNPHFNIVKLGFIGVYSIFLISAKKHRLWVLVRTASPSGV